MRFQPATGLALVLVVSTCFAQSSSDFMVDCSKNSRISQTTTANDLIKIFGASKTINGQIQVGEGFTQPGTIVFPGDAKKRLNITWGQRTKEKPMVVTISSQNTVWHTFGGIGMGMSLKEIEKINGRPFSLTGFGRDYDGTTTSWQNGNIGRGEKGCRILLRLRPGDSDLLQKKQWIKQVRGVGNFSSVHPAMRALNPRVYEILVGFWNR